VAFTYYKSVTVDHTQCGTSDSSNFPVSIWITDADFKTVGNGGYVQNSNGYDIRPYADSGLTTPLTFELVPTTYVATTGAFEMHVQIPTLSHTSDTVFYLAFGDSGISTDGSSSAVWSSANYYAVYHNANGSTLALTDSSGLGYNLTNHNSATAVAGLIDGAVHTDLSSSQYLSNSSSAIQIGSGANFQLSGWINRSSTSIPMSFGYGTTLGYRNNLHVYIDGNTYITQESDGINPHYEVYTDGNTGWTLYHYIGFLFLSQVFLDFYINGVLQTPTGGAGSHQSALPLAANLGDYVFGRETASLIYNTGDFDEMRCATVGQSADWILSEYNSQKPGSTFLSFGALTPIGGGGTGSPHMLLLGLG
jgi:hypothetical protein